MQVYKIETMNCNKDEKEKLHNMESKHKKKGASFGEVLSKVIRNHK